MTPPLHRRRPLLAATTTAITVLLLAGCATSPGGSDTTGAADSVALLPAAEGVIKYPLTISTAIGETVIEERPSRVIMGSSWDADLFAALGVTPVATDDQVEFYPWALEAFPEAIETTWPVGDVPYPAEQIAATGPDLIVDLSAVDAESLEQVSEIAPVLGAPSAEESESLWQDRILLLGEVLDLSDRAQEVIDGYEADLAALRAEYPQLDGKTLDYVVYWGEEYGTGFQNTAGSDAEALFTDLGFAPNPAAGDAVFEDVLSDELLGVFSGDVLLISNQATPAEFDEWYANPLIQGLASVQDDRVVILDLAQEDFTLSHEGEPTGFQGHFGRAFSLGPLAKFAVANVIAPLVGEKLQ